MESASDVRSNNVLGYNSSLSRKNQPETCSVYESATVDRSSDGRRAKSVTASETRK